MPLQFTSPYSTRIAVIGAGTMGSGIALACLLAGLPVMLFDVKPEVMLKAEGYIEKHLERKGKLTNLAWLDKTSDLEPLSKADLVIEAVPEELELKRQLFAQLEEICAPTAILATNTSTLPVTAIASALNTPQRVGGLHFFNPATVIPLVEVVRGAATSQATIQDLVAFAERIGKTAVVTRDTPGFIVNRLARPFYGEALRLLGEGVAAHAQIDSIVRLGGGFRMGPFELMDLIGIDINYKAMRSMYEQTFGEPRYRPHPIQVRMVQQNTLGRKTGQGFYHYPRDPELPDPQANPTPGSGKVLLTTGSWAPGLVQLCQEAGYECRNDVPDHLGLPEVAVVTAGRDEGLQRVIQNLDRRLPASVAIVCQSSDTTVSEMATWVRAPERIVGYDGLFLASGKVATLTPSPTLNPHSKDAAATFFNHLGRPPQWINDSPAMILPRLVAMLANEAAFAVSDAIANPDEIDLAMRLGANYPHGSLEWAKKIGYAKLISILSHLQAEFGEERYRAAPTLRRWARIEKITV